MNGLELSEKYFEEYGRPMLENDFPELFPFLAAGFTGCGSERFGFDDDISHDHDYEPGFLIFIPDEALVDSRAEFRLERAYAKLPKEFLGFKRQPVSPVGGSRSGVIRTAKFFLDHAGTPDGALSDAQWLSLPESALAEATNGKVFMDNFGELTRIRQALQNMPGDIRLKKLAGNLLIMAQSGQYNYTRCLSHGEAEAAQLAANEFVNAAMRVYFLLSEKYMPFYKWSFRALRLLEGGGELADLLSFILTGDSFTGQGRQKKYEAIESTASFIISVLIERGLTKAVCGDLEKHAYSVNDRIKSGEIRNMNILAAV